MATGQMNHNEPGEERVEESKTPIRKSLRVSQKIGPLAKKKEKWFYFLISPWIIGFVLFQAGPVLAAGALSFAHYDISTGYKWIGMENYTTILADPIFSKTMVNTLYYTLVSVPLGMLAAFIFAFLLNQKIRGVTIFRTIFFLPAVIQGIAVIILWGWIFNPKFGLINAGLQLLGIRGPGWLMSETWAMPALIIMSLWSIGWMILIFLAGLQGIPQELYEACELDGGSPFQKLRYITLPLISPVTFFLFITSIMSSMQVFAPTYVLTRGGPNNATMTISLLIYFEAFLWNKMGYAAAAAVFLFIMILTITLVQFGFANRWVYYTTEVD
jgi:multiple sugar transport system permease protein